MLDSAARCVACRRGDRGRARNGRPVRRAVTDTDGGVVSGAVLSTVTVIVASVWRLALSTARAVIVRGPSGTVAVFQSTV